MMGQLRLSEQKKSQILKKCSLWSCTLGNDTVNDFMSKEGLLLCPVARLELHSIIQKVAGLIPSQGTYRKATN